MVLGFQRMEKTGRDWSSWGPSLKECHLKVALDFPGGPVVKSHPPVQGTWVRSLLWEDSLRLGQLRLCATTTETACLKPVLCNKRSHCNESAAPRE